MATLISKIILGTAQFGLDYGVSNSSGKMTLSDVKKTLKVAREAGIRTLDTASAYGDSESVLAKAGYDSLNIITKLSEVPEGVPEVGRWVESQVGLSLRRLNSERIYGLLLHRPAQLKSVFGREIYRTLEALRGQGVLQKIGISIYSPDELATLPVGMTFDVVQAPFNIFDTRMLSSGWADRLADNGVEFHARSIFLQGLLLMPSHQRPPYFSRWNSLFSVWDEWLKSNSISALEACFNFALDAKAVSKFVVGVSCVQDLQELLDLAGGVRRTFSPPVVLCGADENLVNPARWSIK